MTLNEETGYEPVRLPSRLIPRLSGLSLDELQDRHLVERLTV